MYNDYIAHGDHKYLARVKSVGNKYRYFYTQAAYDAYRKLGTAKAVGAGMLSAAQSARDRKRLATTGRRTDVFSEWDKARREEYKKKVVNAAGPGMGWHALDDWNNMLSDFGNTIWKKEHEILAQPTVDTADALNNYYGRSKSSYRVRPANRKKNVTGAANSGSTAKRPLAKILSHHKRRKVGNR